MIRKRATPLSHMPHTLLNPKNQEAVEAKLRTWYVINITVHGVSLKVSKDNVLRNGCFLLCLDLYTVC